MAVAPPEIDAPNNIVLFWYKASPYGRRVATYLSLRNIRYAQCIQPPILPRPDLAGLGVNYRRIPVLAIGRDVYLDTRLIIARLEELYPASAEHPALSTKETAGLAALLHKFAIEAGVFAHAARMIPRNSPMMKDPRFVKDRAEFFGRPKDPHLIMAESITHMRQCFDLMESLLADGRRWIGGSPAVSLADIEGAWAFEWLVSSLDPPPEYFSETLYPKVYAWLDRYKTVSRAAVTRGQPVSIQGVQVHSTITRADFTDKDLRVDRDPTHFREGDLVQIFPLDGGGYTHEDQGRLVKLTKTEVAIAVKTTRGEEIRLHAPRWQWRIRGVEGTTKL